MAGLLAPRTARTVLRGVRVVDPLDPEVDPPLVDITVEGGVIRTITAAGPAPDDDALVVDGGGRFAVPGLVNAHDHLYSHELRTPKPGLDLAEMRRWLDSRGDAETLMRMLGAAHDALAQGITVIRDLGAVSGLNTVLAGLLDRGVVLGPTIVPSGRAVVMTGGHVWTFGREADGPWECRQAVREQKKAGARVIKIMGSGGLSHYPHEDFTLTQLTDEELAAVVDESGRVGLPTASHVFGADAVARVVEHGVDSVEHGVEIRDETLEDMVRCGTGYVPTLTNMERIASPEYNDLAGTPERSPVLTDAVVRPHQETFRQAVAAGVRIAVGTDSTGTYRAELARMLDLGMTPAQVLRAATVTGAEICRAGSGRIEKGARADLALHSGHPLDDLGRLTDPEVVMARGVLVRVPVG